MSDTVMRQWQMLRMVPRSPSKIGATDIKQGLADEGFEVTQRTIQRDLEKFSSIFPLECDDRSKPFGWSWSKDSGTLDIPGMDSHTALAFYLAEQHLAPILPRETVKQLAPHFLTARNMLNKLQTETGATAWADKVRVLRQGPDLSTPDVLPEVQHEVYTALLFNRRLEVEYKARGAKKVKKYTITPLGLVLKNSIFYLPCTIGEYTDIRLLTLHRLSSATKRDMPAMIPEDFNLDDYIASGELSFEVGSKVTLKAIVSRDVAFHLRERQLHPKQKLTAQSDGSYLLEAKVLETSDLRFWLRGYDEAIEILEPAHLREQLYQSAKAMVRKYESR
ncbi:MAG: WYL domain-containing protein [Ghiorsea sp.]|nr:WYL domain-containing protein [Ghiorsea sp.]